MLPLYHLQLGSLSMTHSCILFIIMRTSSGPRTVPCDIPHVILASEGFVSFASTTCVLLLKKLWMQITSFPNTPNLFFPCGVRNCQLWEVKQFGVNIISLFKTPENLIKIIYYLAETNSSLSTARSRVTSREFCKPFLMTRSNVSF